MPTYISRSDEGVSLEDLHLKLCYELEDILQRISNIETRLENLELDLGDTKRYCENNCNNYDN